MLSERTTHFLSMKSITMKSQILIILFLVSVMFFVISSVEAQVSLQKNFDSFVESVQKQFDVPGISIAVVKDDKVLLAKGYGVRKLGSSDRVDGNTLFGIASNTKAFTATAIGLLVEEGKLEWDAPVIKYLPWFRLSDPYVTGELTIRDLLVHRSGLGLGAGDLLWWPPSTYNRKEIAHRLRYIPLSTSFRSTYAYDNVLYIIAGEVIEAVSGQAWENFVATRIIAKVGMTSSNVRHSDALGGVNIATPHAKINGVVRPVRPFESDNTNPAGGINSCANDMAKWLMCQLDSGRVADGSILFSPRTTRQLWSEVTPIPIGDPPPELALLKANFHGYALGFSIRDYHGKKLVTHTGGLPGYVSKVSMIPELKLGIAVLTNQESDAAFAAITYVLLDHFLGAASFDWIRAYKTYVVRIDSLNTAAERIAMSTRDTNSCTSLPLAKYAGTYTDAWYGDVVIEYKDGKLEIQFSHTPSLVGSLEHYQYNTFIARWSDPELRADAFVTFVLNPDGSIDQVKMKAVSPATDFSFDFQDLLLKPRLKKGNETFK
jgi:CubicO group peptidase (beta-lactamase class C family)